jgi:hypothetical protein
MVEVAGLAQRTPFAKGFKREVLEAAVLGVDASEFASKISATTRVQGPHIITNVAATTSFDHALLELQRERLSGILAVTSGSQACLNPPRPQNCSYLTHSDPLLNAAFEVFAKLRSGTSAEMEDSGDNRLPEDKEAGKESNHHRSNHRYVAHTALDIATRLV